MKRISDRDLFGSEIASEITFPFDGRAFQVIVFPGDHGYVYIVEVNETDDGIDEVFDRIVGKIDWASGERTIECKELRAMIEQEVDRIMNLLEFA